MVKYDKSIFFIFQVLKALKDRQEQLDPRVVLEVLDHKEPWESKESAESLDQMEWTVSKI